MGFKVAVVFYSKRGMLVTLANVIAEGAKKASIGRMATSCLQQIPTCLTEHPTASTYFIFKPST